MSTTEQIKQEFIGAAKDIISQMSKNVQKRIPVAEDIAEDMIEAVSRGDWNRLESLQNQLTMLAEQQRVKANRMLIQSLRSLIRFFGGLAIKGLIRLA